MTTNNITGLKVTNFNGIKSIIVQLVNQCLNG